MAAQATIRKFAAAMVHALTASGMVLGYFALLAMDAGDWRWTLIWLGIAMVVDGIDGPLARRLRVTEVLPRMDGTVLDLVVDYVTFVLVPAELIRRMGLLPADWGVPAVALILLTACYHYARRDPKTADGYFRGFPAWWNAIAFYFYLAPPSPETALAVIVVLSVLTCTDMAVVHPLRVRHWPKVTAIAIAAWTGAGIVMLVQDGPPAPAAMAVSLLSMTWMIGLGLWRTLRGADEGGAP